RYLDPRNESEPFSREAARYWMPVDLYVGGVEHAVGHLIYARFWTMVLHDLGLLDIEEPATRLFTQGMITAPSYRCQAHGFVAPDSVRPSDAGPVCPQDGKLLEVRVEKMGKSKLNSVAPDELIDRYGADALRLFSMFGGPPVRDLEWSDQGIEGANRFVHRVARLYERLAPAVRGLPLTADGLAATVSGGAALTLRRKTHKTIRKVTHDIELELQLNTAIAALMELVNELYRVTESADVSETPDVAAAVAEALDALSRLLAPFAPHLAEEMNAALGRRSLVATASWPRADGDLLIEDELVLPVQINGKLRGQVEAPRGAGERVVLDLVRADGTISRHLEGKTLARVIHVPDRLINLVLR
ncbi:MAG: class I tRNA ligase family protein, partial [Acidobacteriota bacterium]|nr:class I tRNA ligase family protein [Acidobacteriota bacterium]